MRDKENVRRIFHHAIIKKSMKQHYIKLVLVICFIIPITLLSQEFELSTKSKKAKRFYENGEYYLNENRIYLAKENFQQAIKEDPSFYEAYVMLGDVFEQEKDDSTAIIFHIKALETNPDLYPPTYFIVANLSTIAEVPHGVYSEVISNILCTSSTPFPMILKTFVIPN